VKGIKSINGFKMWSTSLLCDIFLLLVTVIPSQGMYIKSIDTSIKPYILTYTFHKHGISVFTATVPQKISDSACMHKEFV